MQVQCGLAFSGCKLCCKLTIQASRSCSAMVHGVRAVMLLTACAGRRVRGSQATHRQIRLLCCRRTAFKSSCTECSCRQRVQHQRQAQAADLAWQLAVRHNVTFRSSNCLAAAVCHAVVALWLADSQPCAPHCHANAAAATSTARVGADSAEVASSSAVLGRHIPTAWLGWRSRV